MGKIPGLSFLRIAAALMIVTDHIGFWSGASANDGGGRLLARLDVGVAIFFALSGYLLTQNAAANRPVVTLKIYALRRAARLYPGYLIALMAVWAVMAVQGFSLGGISRMALHIILMQGMSSHSYRAFSQTWSLTSEVMFYALVPLISAWLRKTSRHGALVVLSTVAVTSIVVQGCSSSSHLAHAGALSTSVIGHASWFCVGIAIGVLGDDIRHIAPSAWWALAGCVYTLAATPLAGPTGLEIPSFAQGAMKELLYALIAAGALAGFMQVKAPHPDWLDDAAEASYALFLWHLLVIDVLFQVLGLHLFRTPFLPLWCLTLIVSCPIAWLSWTCVEKTWVKRAHAIRPST